MTEVTSKLLTYKDLIDLPRFKAAKLAALRVYLKVVYKPNAIEIPEELNFVSHEPLKPIGVVNDFQDQLAGITEKMYNNCDMLYGFSNYDPQYEFTFQLIEK